MKKKILSMLIMSAFVISIAGCNSGTETPESTENAEVTTTTTAPETKEITTTTQLITTTSTTPTEEDNKGADFGGIHWWYSEFSDEMAFIYTSDGRKLLINTSGDVVFEFDESWKNVDLLPEKVSNGSFVYGSSSYSNRDGDKMFYLINDNGNIIRSTGKDEYTAFIPHKSDDFFSENYYKVDGYVVAYKEFKKFDGYEYQLGVLNDKGDWVVPLSSDLNFFSLTDVDYSNLPKVEFTYLGNNTVAMPKTNGWYSTYCCYNYLKDEFIATDLPGEPLSMSDTTIILNENGKLLYYNIESKEMSETKISDVYCLGNALLIEDDEGNWSLCDNGGETIFEFDIKFDLNTYYKSIYQDEHFIGVIRDNNYESYLLRVGNTGEFAFEPIYFEDEGGGNILSKHKLKLYNNTIYLATDTGVNQYSLTGDLLKTTKINDYGYDDYDYEAVYPEYELIEINNAPGKRAFIDFDGNIVIK